MQNQVREGWGSPIRATLHFPDGVSLPALGSVLLAVGRFDARVSALMPDTVVYKWGAVPQLLVEPEYLIVEGARRRGRVTMLSRHIRSHERLVKQFGAQASLVAARFESPGFITVGGSGALEKLIDLLHSGNLQNEERQAIIERIHAETDLLKSQATQRRIQALAAAIGVLKSVGVPDDVIVRSLRIDKGLASLLGGPLVSLQEAMATGSLEKVEIVTE